MYETLSADEILYHQRVQAILADAQAANRSWIEHIAQKYNLSREDRILLDGRIQRKPDSLGDQSTNTDPQFS